MSLLIYQFGVVVFNFSFRLTIITIFVMICASPLVLAQPNILGTYSGTATDNTFNCGIGGLSPPNSPAPGANGTETSTLTITISSQSGTSFSGSGTQTFTDGSADSVTFNGTVDDFGNVSGSYSTSGAEDTTSGSFSGTISGGIFSVSFSGQTNSSVANIFCQTTGSATLSLISSSSNNADIIVIPELTPSSTVTTPETLKTEIKTITSDLQVRINDVLRTIQLRRKQFPFPHRPRENDRRRSEENSFLPSIDNDDVVMDPRKQKDEQIPVQIRPTQSGLIMNTLSGMNAGDSPYLYGVWASYSYSDFENDFTATAFDGDRHAGLAGMDVSPWESVLLGVAVGYETTDIDTDFNRGNQETDGFTIAPYFGGLLTDTWSVDFSFGYSNLETDQFRTLPGTTTRVTSSPDHDRWFLMLNVNGLTTYNNWIIGGTIGMLYAKNEQNSYIESDGTVVSEFDSELGQWNIGADIAYSYGEYEPFARVTYENDYSQTAVGVVTGQQPSFDDDDVLLAVGLRYFGENNLIGNVEFNTRLGREDYDEFGLTATLRYEW